MPDTLPCPYCQAELSDADIDSGVCPACGKTVEDFSETVDLSSDHDTTPTVKNSSESSQADEGMTRVVCTVDDARSLWQDAVDSDQSEGMSIKSEEKTQTFNAGSTASIPPRSVTRQVEGQSNPHDFELVKVIGRGGMGAIFSARQTSMDREIAVKMILPEQAGSESSKSKFVSEALVTGELDHPNIVPVHELGRTADGTLFYAMKEVKGTSWKDAIAVKTESENIRILMAVCDAVAFAHDHGVVHRDLKPENVMLGDYGEVLVMDWGLAVCIKEGGKAEPITERMSKAGTPAYMAPEMATCEGARLGPWSDIYLLGGILYEIVTGLKPHGGEGGLYACICQAINNQIQESDAEGELKDIALKAMATDAEERYASVKDFQAAIREYQSHLESIVLCERARDDLKKAEKRQDYPTYARAMFGFEQAWELWNENDEAKKGLSVTRLAYAHSAYACGDFELAASVLAKDDPAHRELLAQVSVAQAERARRRRRLTILSYASASLAASLILVFAAAFLMVRNEKLRTEEQFARRLVADLSQTIALKLQLADFDRKGVMEIERLLQELAGMQATEAERLRPLLHEAMAENLSRDLSFHRIDEAAIEEKLQLLEERDKVSARDLRQVFEGRKQIWRGAALLEPPFANLVEVLPEKTVEIDGNVLHSTSGSKPILLKTVCKGNSRFEVSCSQPSEQTQICLLINAVGSSGYRFKVTLPRPSTSSELQQKKVVLSIWRNKTILLQRTITQKLSGKGLRIEARRLGQQLSLQLNSLPALVIFDAFTTIPSNRGAFGLILSRNVSLQRVQASLQQTASKPSSLERGDALFTARQFSRARAQYEKQELVALDSVLRQECRYKRALCMLHLNQKDDVGALLEAIVGESREPWSLLAGCKLWELRVSSNDFDAADEVYLRTANKYGIKKMLTYMPGNVRHSIVRAYRTASTGLMVFLRPEAEKRLSTLERCIDVQRLFQFKPKEMALMEFQLLRAQRLAGKFEKAFEQSRLLVRNLPYGEINSINILKEYVWMLRLRGEHERALKAIAPFLYAQNGVVREGRHELLIERARSLVLMGQPEQAEKELQQYFDIIRKTPTERYLHRSSAALILGFICHDRGDITGARKAWTMGFAGEQKGSTRMGILQNGSGREMMQFGLCAGLVSDMNSTFLFQCMDILLRRHSKSRLKNSSALTLLSMGVRMILQQDPSYFLALRKTSKGEEFRELAKHAALLDISFPDYIRLPLVTGFFSFFREMAFSRAVTEQEEKLLRDLSEWFFADYIKGHLSSSDVLPLAMTWRGFPNRADWDLTVGKLQPKAQGAFAYIFAHRLLKLKNRAQALEFFRMARALSRHDSLSGALATKEIQTLVTSLTGRGHRQIKVLSSKQISLRGAKLHENSGMTQSRIDSQVVWMHNDSGDGANLYAMGRDGVLRSVLRVQVPQPRDWEDMSSFVMDGTSCLLAADVGDNMANRPHLTLTVIEEPKLKGGESELKTAPLRQLKFSFAGGARDCEAVAVDPESLKVYLVDKKDGTESTVFVLPSVRKWPREKTVEKAQAEKIAKLNTGLVTAMDIDSTGRYMVIMTYGDAFLFTRRSKQTWKQALTQTPLRLKLPARKQGEAICFGRRETELLLSSEVAEGAEGGIPLITIQFPDFPLPAEAGKAGQLIPR